MKAVLSLSGGADSTTLLYHLLNRKEVEQVYLLSLNYNQRHKKELQAVDSILEYIRRYENLELSSKIKDHKVVRLDLTQFGNDSVLISDNQVPDQSENNQSSTVVPYRNTLFTVLIASYAKAVGADLISLGVCLNDFSVYPDCRRQFFDSLQQTLRLSGENPSLLVETPFVSMHKKDITELALKMQVPLHLCWTCYRGQDRPCVDSLCDSCSERVEGFLYNQIPDPIYSYEEWARVLEAFKKTSWYTQELAKMNDLEKTLIS